MSPHWLKTTHRDTHINTCCAQSCSGALGPSVGQEVKVQAAIMRHSDVWEASMDWQQWILSPALSFFFLMKYLICFLLTLFHAPLCWSLKYLNQQFASTLLQLYTITHTGGDEHIKKHKRERKMWKIACEWELMRMFWMAGCTAGVWLCCYVRCAYDWQAPPPFLRDLIQLLLGNYVIYHQRTIGFIHGRKCFLASRVLAFPNTVFGLEPVFLLTYTHTYNYTIRWLWVRVCVYSSGRPWLVL